MADKTPKAEKIKTVEMFDAELQEVCEHTVDIDDNGEIVITSVETGRFTKLPATTTSAELKDYIEKHAESNKGQITKASMDAKRAELLKDL